MGTTTIPAGAWTDEQMRSAIRAHMRDTGLSAHRLAGKIGCTDDALERWLFTDGVEARTVFKARLQRFMRTLESGDQATQNGSNGHHPEPDAYTSACGTCGCSPCACVEPEPEPEPEPMTAQDAIDIERILHGDQAADEMATWVGATVTFPDAPADADLERHLQEDETWVGKSVTILSEPADQVDVVRCRECGCTEDDCSSCVERTGEPCHWVEPDLCSACATVTFPEVTIFDAPAAPFDVVCPNCGLSNRYPGTFAPDDCGNCGHSISDVERVYDQPGHGTTWTPPDGFELLAPPPPRALAPGITIAKDFGGVSLSKALHGELDWAERILVFSSSSHRQVLIRAANPDDTDAMKVSKGRDVSTSISRWAQSLGIAPGFYEAKHQPGQGWLIQF